MPAAELQKMTRHVEGLAPRLLENADYLDRMTEVKT
jgi:hypothetical protein